MRRFFMGMAIASLTVASPIAAQAGDREIADTIVQTLKSRQTDGSLKDFDIDLAVEAGVVTLTGSVANAAQAIAVVDATRSTGGVIEIINEIEVREKVSMIKPASANEPIVAEEKSTDVMPAPALTEPAPMATATSPEDAAITDGILSKLSEHKNQGKLRHFELDISTVQGEVWVRGHVASAEQKQLVLSAAQNASGVIKVVDDVSVGNAKSVSVVPASNSTVVSQQPMPMSSMPTMGQPAVPQAFAQSTLTNFQGAACYADGTPIDGSYAGGGYSSGGPVPMSAGPSYGAGVPRYDTPQMPNYAWPSYAAYPNYAAVTYPKQYSASAWPYIGPFYPYPQVPLGWRKVALEWDDGLWYLDFSHKSSRW
jgi:osmotically-inducible protein OsmY